LVQDQGGDKISDVDWWVCLAETVAAVRKENEEVPKINREAASNNEKILSKEEKKSKEKQKCP
jgi:hypothetical protein